MELLRAIENRHSVRQYLDKPLEPKIIEALTQRIDEINAHSGLHIQLCINNPQAFDSKMAHYGKFRGVQNHLALIGPKGSQLQEMCGYYGEQLVLYAQCLGLNTCWVALTYNKKQSSALINPGEERACIIALGYGQTQGVPHTVRPLEKLYRVDGRKAPVHELPEWFLNGMEAALLAPTAMNQQRFIFDLKDGNRVDAYALSGPYSAIDLGIVKYHFEIAANALSTDWSFE